MGKRRTAQITESESGDEADNQPLGTQFSVKKAGRVSSTATADMFAVMPCSQAPQLARQLGADNVFLIAGWQQQKAPDIRARHR